MILFQINSVINSDSTGRIAEEIGQVAIKNGWESYIAYGRNERPSQSKKIKIGNEWDIKWHGLMTRLFDRHCLASTRATKELVKNIDKIKPDIIHLHNLHGYYQNIKILFNYLAAANIPVVWTLHDCWALTGHCAYFSFIGCEKWKTQCEHCPQKTGYPASYLFDRSFKNYLLKKELFTSVRKMTLVPVSKWLANILKDSFLKSYPVKTIYNGIDTTVFSPKETMTVRKKYKIPDNKFVLLGVASRWTDRKGLKDYIRLSQLLKNDEVIILVGVTDRIIKTLPQNIIGVKSTENLTELAELYSLADIFINPTWDDNFPTTNIESLSCGTPVITYNTGGSPEAITPETGFIVEQGDLTGIRNAIDTVKSRGKSFYSSACRERAVKMFDKNDRYAEYIQLYEIITNEK